MNRSSLAFCALVALFICAVTFNASAAGSKTEAELIAILSSDASLQEKDAACAQLKITGTAASVAPLAELLTDQNLSHTARYALESMELPEAGQAISDALEHTTGSVQLGILQSLKMRKEGDVEKLADLLGNDADPQIAIAAAGALGALATPAAERALTRGLSSAGHENIRTAIYQGLLNSAYSYVEQGKREEASAVFTLLAEGCKSATIQAAALIGAISIAPETRAIELIVEALQSNVDWRRKVAMRAALELETPAVTAKLVAIATGTADANLQSALIGILHQRGDISAMPAMLQLAASPEPAVRVAALTAIGDLGDPESIPTLIKASASSHDEESKAALQSLLVIRRGDVNPALIGELVNGTAPVQKVVVRTLIARADTGVVPDLADLAGDGHYQAQLALVRLAKSDHVPMIVRIVQDADNEAQLKAAGEALHKVCVRLTAEENTVNPEPIIGAYANGKLDTRRVLLPTITTLKDPRLRQLTQEALKSEDNRLRAAAEEALFQTNDPSLLSDMFALAERASDKSVRLKRARAILRLITDTHNGLTKPQIMDALQQITPMVSRPEEKWMILGSLAENPTPQALELALPMLDEPDTKAEAIQSVTKIASEIYSSHREVAEASLRKVLSVATEPAQTEAATAVLDRITTSAVSSPQ